MATSPYFKGENGVSRRKEKQGEAAAECPGIAPSIIFTREGARETRRRGRSLCSDLLTRMPVGHLYRRRCHDSPESAGGGRRKDFEEKKEKLYYRNHSIRNSVRLNATLKTIASVIDNKPFESAIFVNFVADSLIAFAEPLGVIKCRDQKLIGSFLKLFVRGVDYRIAREVRKKVIIAHKTLGNEVSEDAIDYFHGRRSTSITEDFSLFGPSFCRERQWVTCMETDAESAGAPSLARNEERETFNEKLLSLRAAAAPFCR